MSLISITDLNLYNKTVLIRSDLNVPINNGRIISDFRIRKSLKTIKFAITRKSKIIIASHLGSPVEGEHDKKFSLKPIAAYLSSILKINVRLVKDYINNYEKIRIDHTTNEIILLENVRFNYGESKNCHILSKKYAKLCDIFVMDAFATAHRKHASTYGILSFANMSCIGLLMQSEMHALDKIFSNPKRPVVSIVGGSKISTKFNVLNSLAKISDALIVGGGISNTFIATNNNIGKSIYEPNFISHARKLMETYNVITPIDVLIKTSSNKRCSENSFLRKINEIKKNEIIMDLGHETIKKILLLIDKSKTVIWNGPVGVFESKNFCVGTNKITKGIAKSKAYSIIGGGDTISAVSSLKLLNKISYISTGGGAFLKYIEKRTFPLLKLLKNKIMAKTDIS